MGISTNKRGREGGIYQTHKANRVLLKYIINTIYTNDFKYSDTVMKVCIQQLLARLDIHFELKSKITIILLTSYYSFLFLVLFK